MLILLKKIVIIKKIQKDKRWSKKMKKQTGKKVLLVFIILSIIGVASGGLLLYGPWAGFRDWLITSAMTTMNHQYLATWFYDDETIGEVLSNNTIHETDEITDTETIVVNLTEKPEKIEYANEYERAVLEKDPDNDDYKIIEIEGKGYSGYLAVIYDPSRIKTVYTKHWVHQITPMMNEKNMIIMRQTPKRLKYCLKMKLFHMKFGNVLVGKVIYPKCLKTQGMMCIHPI